MSTPDPGGGRSLGWVRTHHYKGSASESWMYADPSTGRRFEVRIDRAPRLDPSDPSTTFPDRYYLTEHIPNGRLGDSDWTSVGDIPQDLWLAVHNVPSEAFATIRMYEAGNPGMTAGLHGDGYGVDSIYLASWADVDAAAAAALDEDRWYFSHQGHQQPMTIDYQWGYQPLPRL
jgi:hypothetical protein